MAKFLGRNVAVHRLCDGLKSGDVRHALSDGRWSLIDLLDGLASVCGSGSALDLAIWTASGAHGEQLHEFIESGKLQRICLMIDRSFVSRKPDICEKIVQVFGAKNLRVWQAHAKFAIFHGGDIEVLAMFSANLNRNTRVENFTVWADAEMVAAYRAMVAELWALQPPQQGLLHQGDAMTRYTRPILGDAEQPRKPKTASFLLDVVGFDRLTPDKLL